MLERHEFGNEDHIRLVREAEEEATRREAGVRRWRVTYGLYGSGEVLVDASTEEEARHKVEAGEVHVDLGEWEDMEIETVEPVDSEPQALLGSSELQAPPVPEQAVFPF